jgi:hypothetical protein
MKNLQQLTEEITKLGDATNFAIHVANIALPVGTVLNGMKAKGETVIGYDVEKNEQMGGTPLVYYITKEGSKVGFLLATKTQK